MQVVSTVSSFLHIMIRHSVDFCKNEPASRSNNFSFKLYSISDDVNDSEFVFISFMKNQSRGSNPFKRFWCTAFSVIAYFSLFYDRTCCMYMYMPFWQNISEKSLMLKWPLMSVDLFVLNIFVLSAKPKSMYRDVMLN